MAITTADGLTAAMAGSTTKRIFFQSATNVASGIVNLNQLAAGSFGLMSAPAAASAGGTTYNQSTQSVGFPKWTGVPGTQAYFGAVTGFIGTNAGSLSCYDMCWACSGLVGNVTTAQAITGFSGLPAREPTGEGLEIWIGCSGAIGATAHNVTVTYTNSEGVAGRVTPATSGIVSMPVGRMYQLPLQSGDIGVRSIQSIQLSASSGTAGNLWVMIIERYWSVGMPVGGVAAQPSDFFDLGGRRTSDEACLLFANVATTTASGLIMGDMAIIHG